MSPNLVDLDRALEDLKAEAPSGEQRQRALALLVRPPRPRWRLAGLAAASLSLTAVALLAVPSRGSGLAWTAVVRNTQSAVNIHTRTFDKAGRPTSEGWRSGLFHVHIWHNAQGQVTAELRRDGKTMYWYTGKTPLALPNAYHFAWLASIPSINPFQGSSENTIGEMLTDKRTKVLRHASAEIEGRTVERYEVSLYGGETATVDADPVSGRVLRIDRKQETRHFDYPEKIDPALFSWTARVSRNVPVLDMRNLDPNRDEPTKEVLAKKDGLQLRELQIEPYGSLIVTWAGERYSRLLRKPFRVVGVKTGKPWYGPAPYLMGKRKFDALTTVKLPLLEKVGERLTIQIPTGPRSVVVFKDIPVTRLRPVSQLH